MKKIAEMNTEEMGLMLCQIAEPAARIMSDGYVSEAFVEMGKRLDKNATLLQNIAVFTSVLIPVLLGEQHKNDTYAVLAALNGKTTEDIRKQNGFKTAKELFEVFMVNRDTTTIFRPDQETRS